MNTKTTISIIVAIAACLLSGIVGYKLKKCPEIVKTKTETAVRIDTVKIPEVTIRTIPRNIPFYVPMRSNPKLVYIHDSIPPANIPDFNYGYESTDTLSNGGIHVAISDKGDCYGVKDRRATWYGTAEREVITNTITNTVSQPPAFLQLYAGASGNFSNKFKAFDFGPAVGISVRNRYRADYSYQFNSKSHFFTISTKIR